MVEKAESQIKAKGNTPLNALLPRFFHNDDCLLCPGNNDIKMADDSNRTLVIDFLAPPAQEGFYPAAREVSTAPQPPTLSLSLSLFHL